MCLNFLHSVVVGTQKPSFCAFASFIPFMPFTLFVPLVFVPLYLFMPFATFCTVLNLSNFLHPFTPFIPLHTPLHSLRQRWCIQQQWGHKNLVFVPLCPSHPLQKPRFCAFSLSCLSNPFATFMPFCALRFMPFAHFTPFTPFHSFEPFAPSEPPCETFIT